MINILLKFVFRVGWHHVSGTLVNTDCQFQLLFLICHSMGLVFHVCVRSFMSDFAEKDVLHLLSGGYRDVDPMLVHCWPSRTNSEPTLDQHFVSAGVRSVVRAWGRPVSDRFSQK